MLDENVKKTVDEIKNEEDDSNPDESKKSCGQSDELIALLEEQDPTLFYDEMGEAHIQLTIDKLKEIMRCESRRFEKYLYRLYWQKTDKLISTDNLNKVVKLIAARAEYGELQIALHNRIAPYKDDFWYDLGNSRVVRCQRGSWGIVTDVPILFRTYQHQDAQVDPVVTGGDVRKILSYVRIKNEEHKILFLVWLITAFVPEIPHAILILFGEKGASKSTSMRFARKLIDPSKVGLLALPRPGELVQQLSHHHAAFYDNVNKISQGTSDILCRGVTGAGASKRRLYTDDEDVIYQFRRVIGLNGINNSVHASDLLDRSLLIELKRIPKKACKTEMVLNCAFEADRPIILGGIFEVLAKAMVIFDELNIVEFPRMADFAKWGYAIAEALNIGGEAFIEAYQANINQQNEEIIENDPVAHTIALLMDKGSPWEGSATELHEEILKIAEEAKLDAKLLPKTPAILGREINIVLSNLLDAGIRIEKKKDTGGRRGRFFSISRLTVAPVSAVSESDEIYSNSDRCDGSDSKMRTLGNVSNGEIKEIFGEETEIEEIPFN